MRTHSAYLIITTDSFKTILVVMLVAILFFYSGPRSSAAGDLNDPRQEGGQPKRWLGHSIGASPELVSRFQPQANLVLDNGWRDYDDAVIKAARKAKKKVVLLFNGKTLSDAKAKGIALAKANHDVVLALCWCDPYFDRHQPAELALFGRQLKESVPGIQFWGEFVDKPREEYQKTPIPEEIDTIIVAIYFNRTPQSGIRMVSNTLPGWITKAKGRPVLLDWNAWENRPPGLIPKCAPNTMKICASIADEYGLAGLILGHYGKQWGRCDGLETRPDMIKEIGELAENFVARKERQVVSATTESRWTDLTAPKAEPSSDS